VAVFDFEIPEDATRIRVQDPNGKILWRKIKEIKDTDVPDFNDKGAPVFMKGAPGKPSLKEEVAKASTPAEAKKVLKKEYMKKDGVASTVNSNLDSSDVLDSVIKGLAEETASLAYEREEAEKRGESTSQISLRRVNALRAVGDVWLKKRDLLSSKSLDLESKAFQVVFGHIAETFRKACDEAGVRPEMSETIFANFAKFVDDEDWIREAKSKMEKI